MRDCEVHRGSFYSNVLAKANFPSPWSHFFCFICFQTLFLKSPQPSSLLFTTHAFLSYFHNSQAVSSRRILAIDTLHPLMKIASQHARAQGLGRWSPFNASDYIHYIPIYIIYTLHDAIRYFEPPLAHLYVCFYTLLRHMHPVVIGASSTGGGGASQTMGKWQYYRPPPPTNGPGLGGEG